MENKQLEVLMMRLKSGEYDGVHIMKARIAIEELILVRYEKAALTDALKELLNDCINFGGDHLTDRILEDAAFILAKSE